MRGRIWITCELVDLTLYVQDVFTFGLCVYLFLCNVSSRTFQNNPARPKIVMYSMAKYEFNMAMYGVKCHTDQSVPSTPVHTCSVVNVGKTRWRVLRDGEISKCQPNVATIYQMNARYLGVKNTRPSFLIHVGTS